MFEPNGAVAAAPGSLPGDEIAEKLRKLLRRHDQLMLQAAKWAAQLERLGYGQSQDSVSTVDWIRHECKLNFKSAADLVCVGLEMHSLAASVAAVRAGEIGFQHLVLIARTDRGLRKDERWRRAMEEAAGGPSPYGASAGYASAKPAAGPAGAWPQPRPQPEAHLLAEAKEVSVSRFRHVCKEARDAADPARVAGEQARAMEERSLCLSRRQDGFVTLNGILDPIGGATLRSALEPLARPGGRHDGRRLELRLADALVELSQHAMDQASPRQRPHLNATATLGTPYQSPGSVTARMAHGDPVSGVTVERLTRDSEIRCHIFSPASMLVEVRRRKRAVSAQLRKALEACDKHCRWPGCTRPGHRCEVHYPRHWPKGGKTDQENLLLLCHRHHVQVHEGRWQLLVDPDGHVEMTMPPLDLAAPPRGPSPWEAA
jgi:hypothetical protein